MNQNSRQAKCCFSLIIHRSAFIVSFLCARSALFCARSGGERF
jgi:hypothetical protein